MNTPSPSPVLADAPFSRVAAAAALAWSAARMDAGVLRRGIALWTPAAPAAALGLSQSEDVELDLAACRADGVAVVRRPSGGGAVLLADGVLCWEAFAPPLPPGAPIDLRGAYAELARPVVEACGRLGAAVAVAGISDLATAGPDGALRKVAGMAQWRRRGGVLVHGSLLVSMPVASMARYLRPPSEQPAYRAGRAHDVFCQTLADALGRSLSMAEVARSIVDIALEGGWEVRRME